MSVVSWIAVIIGACLVCLIIHMVGYADGYRVGYVTGKLDRQSAYVARRDVNADTWNDWVD